MPRLARRSSKSEGESNPDDLRGDSLDCFAEPVIRLRADPLARNDGEIVVRCFAIESGNPNARLRYERVSAVSSETLAKPGGRASPSSIARFSN
jgi:hypothetical protein